MLWRGTVLYAAGANNPIAMAPLENDPYAPGPPESGSAAKRQLLSMRGWLMFAIAVTVLAGALWYNAYSANERMDADHPRIPGDTLTTQDSVR